MYALSAISTFHFEDAGAVLITAISISDANLDIAIDEAVQHIFNDFGTETFTHHNAFADARDEGNFSLKDAFVAVDGGRGARPHSYFEHDCSLLID